MPRVRPDSTNAARSAFPFFGTGPSLVEIDNHYKSRIYKALRKMYTINVDNTVPPQHLMKVFDARPGMKYSRKSESIDPTMTFLGTMMLSHQVACKLQN
jgi:hypothetical protein